MVSKGRKKSSIELRINSAPESGGFDVDDERSLVSDPDFASAVPPESGGPALIFAQGQGNDRLLFFYALGTAGEPGTLVIDVKDQIPWLLTVHFTGGEAGAVGDIAEFTLKRLDDAPMRPSDLQRFAWSRYFHIARCAMAFSAGGRQHKSKEWAKTLLAIAEASGVAVPTLSTPGRKGHPREFYEQVAARYLQLLAMGETAPDTVLAREMNQARSTVAGWVRRARELELLPPARAGRAG